jgi:hypothetical protein
MNKKFIIASVLVLVLSLTIFTSVTMAEKPETVGTRILMYAPPASFDAGEPFYIQHGIGLGWFIGLERVGNNAGKGLMTLEVDGVKIEPDFVTREWINYKPEYPLLVQTKLFTFNFPDGLEAGEHTFVRSYFFTCQFYWDMGIDVECENPVELIEYLPMKQTVTISFVD